MPSTRQGSSSSGISLDDPSAYDQFINKICEKLKDTFTSIIETTVDSKTTEILTSVNDIKNLLGDYQQRQKNIDHRFDALEQYSRRNNLPYLE